MSSKNDSAPEQAKSRRGFLKAGLGGAASVVALGMASQASAEKPAPQQETKEDVKWVGAGYLMARPVNSSEIV
jgi:hypothetical protein